MPKMLRVAALRHSGCGVVRVKVIFRNGRNGEKKCAYWMNQEVYDAIPLMVDATPDDYRKHGELNEAEDTNIYNNK